MNTTLAKDINWVGYIDWTVRDFHGYKTTHGSTYNAYLVQDEKNALIDTVKAPYAETLLAHITNFCSPEDISYVVCNHAEPDHSSALPFIMSKCVNAELVCNAKCKDALSHHFDTTTWKFKIVGEGETLSLGSKTLQFFNTPMVHWPESMVTYVPEEEILFSMDAFGQHIATSQRFDDEVSLDVILDAAKTYYANIVMPYGKPVTAAIAKLGALKLKIVAPSHGVIWRSNFAKIVECYQKWVVTKAEKKVVVAYCSMWNSTKIMAEKIAEGASTIEGVDVKLIDVNATHDTETVTELMDCAGMAIGSATLNMGIMPAMARMLYYIKGLHPINKFGFAFGSYGWAEKGATQADGIMSDFGVEKTRTPITSRFKPDSTILEECFKAGKELAEKASLA